MLASLLESPLRRPRLFGVTTLAVALVATAAWQWRPPRYRAAALVGVQPPAAGDARDALARRLKDPALLRRAARELSEGASAAAAGQADLAPERLADGLSVRPMASTACWVEFVHPDRATAARVANTAARLLARDGDVVPRVELLREASAPSAATSTALPLVVLAAALLGLGAGFALAFAAERRDATVKGPEDLAQVLPVPVLATIPKLRGSSRDASD